MNSPFHLRTSPAAIGFVILLTLATSVGAIMNEIDLGGEIDLTDDAGIYVTVLSRYFGQEPQQVKQWYDLCPDKDDLAIILFLSRTTEKSPAYVLALRGQGLDWWEINQGLSVNPNIWFIQVKSGLRAPYSEPYAKWTAAGEGGAELVLSDAECRNLIAAKFLNQYFELTIARAMELRATGKGLKEISAEEVRRRQENGAANREKLASGSAS